jgi:hypothetical protein
MFSSCQRQDPAHGVAYSCLSKVKQKLVSIYAAGSTALFGLLTFIGVFLSNKFLLSFEFVILFISPAGFICRALNLW